MAKKRKIGIITLPLNNYNYGGVLQAYALKIYLERLGNEVVYLNRQYNISIVTRIKIKIYNLLNYSNFRKKKFTNAHLIRFIKENLNLTKPFYNKTKIESFIDSQKLDVLITGSDQVWRQDYALNIYSDLFLNFSLKNNPIRLSYATSFGKDSLSANQSSAEIYSFLNKFKAISVREMSGVEICKQMGVNNATHNIDPIMLLNIDDYKMLINKAIEHSVTEKATLVNYILDKNQEKISFIDKIANINKLQIKRIGKKIDVSECNSKNLKIKSKDSIEKWLHGFASAELVITDSFHGCAFSILFNKQFIAIGNPGRGLARFQSLLKLFNLEERLILDFDVEKAQKLIETKIDFQKVNVILENERKKSKKYFEENLI